MKDNWKYISKKSEYSYKLFHPGTRQLEIDNEEIDIIIKKKGKEYTGTLITLKYIQELFEKNKKTKECAEGSYFCMPRMVIVRNISEKTIQKTLDAMISKGEFENYFK